MEDKNSVLLFEYLRSILYDSEINGLDIDQLDEPFQKLGKGMQYLQEAWRKCCGIRRICHVEIFPGRTPQERIFCV